VKRLLPSRPFRTSERLADAYLPFLPSYFIFLFTMSFSTIPNRTCWQCQAPIQGRADKKFCTSACKASYSREAAHSESVVVPVAANRPQSASRPPQLEVIDWQARCEQAEQALQHYQQQAAQYHQAVMPFDQEYTRLGHLLSQHTNSQWTVFLLQDVLRQLQDGITFYQQHPGLTDPTHVAHRRLQDMKQVSTYLQQNATALLERKKRPSAGRAY
jgi:hypothetical protein